MSVITTEENFYSLADILAFADKQCSINRNKLISEILDSEYSPYYSKLLGLSEEEKEVKK